MVDGDDRVWDESSTRFTCNSRNGLEMDANSLASSIGVWALRFQLLGLKTLRIKRLSAA